MTGSEARALDLGAARGVVIAVPLGVAAWAVVGLAVAVAGHLTGAL